ncbi:MAG: DUF3110 domain-containing protein [Symploca sp. SIO2E9]|nr:DUF3110 domain-containing protein [Symploca sp. SIO2E9]
MVMPTKVFVILFNARTENEGIHSLKIDDRDVVLMFEQEDDATRFAIMLEAQDLPPATVEAIDAEEIEEFCRSAGYETKFIEVGMLAVPPETNVETTDWQPETQNKKEPEIPDLDSIRRQLEGLL